MDKAWTILELIRWTTGYLKDKGIESPRTDAELLLACVLKKQRLDLYLNYDQPLTGEELAQFKAALKRRAGREPLQYITGEQEFWSLTLKTTPAALIPRPETEVLVEEALAMVNHISSPLILDLCTGTGAVALALARELPEAIIFASDISLAALSLAKENLIRNGLDGKVHLALGNGLSIFRPEANLDLITVNPPYIPTSALALLPPEIRQHEPAIALDGGKDGLDFIVEFVHAAAARLHPGRGVVCEIGADQADMVVDLVAITGCYEGTRTRKDYAGRDRVVCFTKKFDDYYQ
ncbi:MAG: peptide chain release factor N(5)-glutamine methyltransferase [Deltaproteobacteria bacterium]|nr:peptide chain release factor N(5)-glutamine methyltransferase [Deltaproteobacteria bacterium]